MTAGPTKPMAGPADPGSDRLRLTFLATPQAVRRALTRMRRHYEGGLGSGQSLDAAETVLAEALNNICEHAYPSAYPGEIEMSVERKAGHLKVELRDTGTMMPGGQIPPGVLPVADAAPPEGGFGWFLIRTLADELKYCRHADENSLNLTVPLRDETGI